MTHGLHAHRSVSTRRRWMVALPALVVAALSGCSSGADSSASVAAAPAPAAESAEAAPDYSAQIAASLEGVPPTPATVPDGTYRVTIQQSDLIALKESDLSNAGTWTFTVAASDYRLECSPVASPDTDCGGPQAEYPATVEIGPLRGSGNTMWIVHDVLKTAEEGHCDPLLGEYGNGCGPLTPYSLNWTKVKDGLTFTDPEQSGVRSVAASWWAKPYTKIA